ncbi:CD320 antigen [Orycteropus afer afer]|uniref:CD320 antigen n=1 Tax=Orycteropus afer afer TaxID=1230840 RepID=A0AC54ZAK3_ORYAF|nr:CD320 antigen [Orycteropus afer afer]
MARAGARRTAAVGLALRLLLGLGLGLEAAPTPARIPIPTLAGPSAQALDPSTGSCSPTSFQCRTVGYCVPFTWRCDSDQDCPDGSDEDECRIDPPGIEPCAKDGRCPPPTGCPGGQGKSPHNCSPRPCAAGELRCPLSGVCIPRTWRCDGHPDCPDADDEQGCGTTETLQGGNVTSTATPVTMESVPYVSNAGNQGNQDSGQSENQSALGVIASAAVLSAALAAAALLALCQLIGPGRFFKEPRLQSEDKAFLL